MFDVAEFSSLIVTAQFKIKAPATIIRTPAVLKTAVERQEFINEVEKLQLLLTLLPDEEAIKSRFAQLCSDRDEQNRGTILHFTTNPESDCNQFYFNVAKALYPFSSCLQLCWRLLPMLTTYLRVETRLFKTAARKKEFRFYLLEEPIESLQTNHALVDVPIDASIFKRILLVGNTLFALDEIGHFDFKHHCKFHEQLIPRYLQLKKVIMFHNESFLELYNAIELFQGNGCSLREYFSSVLKHMEGTGEYFGSMEYARDDGSEAAHRLFRYYHDLPIDIKMALGACRNNVGENFLKIIHEIERGECIETVVRVLQEILANPKNNSVLDVRPYLTKKQSDAVLKRYVEGYRKGDSLVDLNGKFNTTAYPQGLVRSFYREVLIENEDQLASYLIDFQPEQYSLLLSEATIEIEDFEYNLETVIPLLNDTQYVSFIRAMGSNREKFDLPSLLMFCMSTDDVRGVQLLLECVPISDRVRIVVEYDRDEQSLFLYSLDHIECFKIMMQCLPKDDQLKPLFNLYQGDKFLKQIAFNFPLLRQILTIVNSELRLVVVIGLLEYLSFDQCQCLQHDQEIRACFSDISLSVFDSVINEHIDKLGKFVFSFFNQALEESDEDLEYIDLSHTTTI